MPIISTARRRLAYALAFSAFAAPAFAIQTCELNGESVNPNNGASTAGKTGLMRCKDADTNQIVREQELQNGKFMGVVRYYKAGQIEREFNVNERGNRDGMSREWSINAADGKRVLVREETMRNSDTIGIARTWNPDGSKRRLTFYGDDKREQASVEFTTDGKLYDLRCAPKPVFGSEFDDKTACGHTGTAATVVLYTGKGLPASRLLIDHGERRKTETLWESGSVREVRELTATGGLERSFSADGTKRHELQWTNIASTDANARPRKVDTLDQEFHESGKLVHERRWTPSARGADLVAESWWYLNGQLKERDEYADAAPGQRLRHETSYFDNGKPSLDASWTLSDSRSYRGDQPTGTHKRFDDSGRVRGESVFDARGKLTREREFDEHGTLVRDDEVFEDGSRRSNSRAP